MKKLLRPWMKYQEYIEELEYAAMCQGIDPQVVGELIKENFSLEEIEDYLYEGYY